MVGCSMDHIIHHDIHDSSEWPGAVQSIACHLYHPLSPSHANNIGSAGSTTVQQGMPEDDYKGLTLFRTVDDIIDAISTFVQKIRAVATLNRRTGRARYHTSTFWSPLLSNLGRMISSHASIIPEASFILPRSDETRFDSLGAIRDGYAHLLISCIVHPDEIAEGPGVNNQTVEDENTDPLEDVRGDIAHEGSEDSASIGLEATSVTGDGISDHVSQSSGSESTSTRSTTSSTSAECPFPVPFCGHVITGCGPRTYAVLPVISVAEPDEIHALLSSILYQRYVWGIRAPAIGISLSATGTIARVIFGWTDPLIAHAGELPTIHFASAPRHCAPAPPLGIYDLEDLSSSLALAQFILGLTGHVDNIFDAARSPRPTPLPWRSDHIFIDQLFPGEADHLEEFYQLPQWAQMSSDSSDSSTHPRTPSSQNSPSLPIVPCAKDKSVHSLSVNEEHGVTGSCSPAPLIHPTLVASTFPVPSQAPPTSLEKALSTHFEESIQVSNPQQCSSFAARDATNDLTGSGTFLTWLMNRGVVRLTRHQFQQFRRLPAAKKAINKKVQLYDSVTAFPVIDMDLITAYKAPARLLEWHDRLKAGYMASSANSEDSVELEPYLQSLLRGRVCDILNTSLYVSQLNKAADGWPVSEPQYRHAWDGLLYSFVITESTAVSQHVVFEQILNLPRNEAFDAVKRNEPVLENYQALAEIDLSLCRGVLLDLGIKQRTSKSRENDHAWSEAQAILTTFDNMTENAFAAAVQEHFVNEPLFVKADACVLFPITLSKPTKISESGVAGVTYRAALRSQCSPGNRGPAVPSEAPVAQAFELPCRQARESPRAKGERCRVAAPVLVTQYGRARKPLYEPLHRAAIACVASLKFAHAAGVADLAVFGLVVMGSVGQLIMCWNDPPVAESEGLNDGNDHLEFCDTRDQTYLLVRNVESFDVSDPVQCFHFATILLRLAKYGHEVTEQFQCRAAEDCGGPATTFFAISKASLTDWTMEAQSAEFKPD